MGVRVTNHFPRLGKVIRTNFRERGEKAAEALAERWQSKAPVDTGAYRDSIHVEAAGDNSHVVVSGVDYDGYLEYGTWKMAARPSFTPAFEEIRAEFPDLFGRLL